MMDWLEEEPILKHRKEVAVAAMGEAALKVTWELPGSTRKQIRRTLALIRRVVLNDAVIETCAIFPF